MTYPEKILLNKNLYPFDKWRSYYFKENSSESETGLTQYTEENCSKAQAIMDTLLTGLINLGETAAEPEKVELFRIAVESYNELDDEVGYLIETVEREDLCELLDGITLSVGLNPVNYGGGYGIADEWREW